MKVIKKVGLTYINYVSYDKKAVKNVAKTCNCRDLPCSKNAR